MGEWTGVFEDVPGNHTARTRIVVTDESGYDHLGLIWALRSQHYSDEPTAAVGYDAADLTPVDAAAAATVGGEAAVQHANLGADWTGVLSTEIDTAGHMTHVGTYAIWARVYTTSEGTAVRFVWDVGNLAVASENDPVTIPGLSDWFWVPLGQLRLDRAPAGDHTWQGLVQAKVGNIAVDKLRVFNVDDGYGVLRAPSGSTVGVQPYEARDELSTAGASLAGEDDELGNTWSGVGDTADFSHIGVRTAVSDSPDIGRWNLVGPDLTTCAVRATTSIQAGPISFKNGIKQGLVARAADADNNLTLKSYTVDHIAPVYCDVVKYLAGTPTTLGVATGSFDATRDLQLEVDEDGAWRVYSGNTLILAGRDDDLATGGDLETGQCGIYDENTSANGLIRQHSSFAVWVPVRNAVLHGDGILELCHNGMFRRDSSGGTYSPVPHVVGDLPRLPPSGAEGQPVELVLLTSRGDFDQLPDTGPDEDLSVAVHVRPTWIFPTLFPPS